MLSGKGKPITTSFPACINETDRNFGLGALAPFRAPCQISWHETSPNYPMLGGAVEPLLEPDDTSLEVTHVPSFYPVILFCCTSSNDIPETFLTNVLS